MTGFDFRKNSTFDWNGVTFRVREMTPNEELVIEAVHSGAVSVVAQKQLLAEYVHGRLTAAPNSTSDAQASAVYSRQLDELKPPARDEAVRRLKYLRAIEAEGRPVFTKAYVDPILLRASIDIGDKKPPGASTVYRWYQQCQAFGANHGNNALRKRRSSRHQRSDLADRQSCSALCAADSQVVPNRPYGDSRWRLVKSPTDWLSLSWSAFRSRRS